MKVQPGMSIVFEGTIYNAGDELPNHYSKESISPPVESKKKYKPITSKEEK